MTTVHFFYESFDDLRLFQALPLVKSSVLQTAYLWPRAPCRPRRHRNRSVIPAGSSAGPAPAPTVATIAPLSGPVTGGTPVTITGTGFVDGASVTVGGAQVTNVVVANPTTITANTPAHAPGTVDVVVTNPDGQSSNSKPFIYCSYTIAEINTSFEEHGGTDGEISVTTTSVCSWTAATSTPWIHSIEATPPSTLGSGTVKFSVRENPSADRVLEPSQLPVRRLSPTDGRTASELWSGL